MWWEGKAYLRLVHCSSLHSRNAGTYDMYAFKYGNKKERFDRAVYRELIIAATIGADNA